jgi:hypothetical protein
MAYAFTMYSSTIRWLLKNGPLSAIRRPSCQVEWRRGSNGNDTLGTLDLILPGAQVDCPPLYGNRHIQRKQPEIVPMCSARRTRPHVAGFTRAVFSRNTDWLSFGIQSQLLVGCRNIEEHSVGKCSSWGVRIVYYQDKRLRAGGRSCPRQWWRYLVTIARET